MGRKKQIRIANKKVSAPGYYKGRDVKRMPRKERDKQLYRKTRDDRVNVNIGSPPLSSAVPGIIDKIDKADEDISEQEALPEALKAAVPLSGVQVKISKQARKKDDLTKDEIRKKGSKAPLKKDLCENSGKKEPYSGIDGNNNAKAYRNKHERIKEDIITDPEKNDKKNDVSTTDKKEKGSIKENKEIMEKADIADDLKSEDHNNDLLRKNSIFRNNTKIPVKNGGQNNEETADILRKRKLAEAAYAGYILWKKKQIKDRKDKASKAKDKKDEGKASDRYNSSEKKKDETKEQNQKKDDSKEQYKNIKRKSHRKKRISRAVNPIAKNVKRNIAGAGYEMKHMPIKTLRMVADDISADELAMRTGRGIMEYMSRIYGSAMKTIGAAVKSLALLAAGVAKDILIAFAPIILIGLIIIFMVYFIFLSPMQSIMGGSGSGDEEDSIQDTRRLKMYCSQALFDSADVLQEKIMTLKPDASIKITALTEENLNDMCKIMLVVMALNGAYPDDEEWLKSPEGQEELNKYAGFMCHQMSQAEIDEQQGNHPEEATTETATQETTTQQITEEASSGPDAEDKEANEIWIGYYTYEYLLESGYLSDIEEFLQ